MDIGLVRKPTKAILTVLLALSQYFVSISFTFTFLGVN
jgi:hypothetical protein